MKRYMLLVGLILCLAVSLGGCKKKSEEPKNSGLESQFGISDWHEKMKVTLPDIGNVDVSIDIKPELHIPEKPYVIQLSYFEDTEAARKSVLKRLFKENSVFYWDPPHWPKEHIGEVIAELEKEQPSETVNQLLEQYRDLYPNAPEALVPAEEYSVDRYLVQLESREYIFYFEKTMRMYTTVRFWPKEDRVELEMLQEGLHKEGIESWGVFLEDEYIKGEATNRCKYSVEEAKEIAALFFSAFGIDTTDKLKVNNLIWQIRTSQSSILETYTYGYLVEYQPWDTEEVYFDYMTKEISISDYGVFDAEIREPFSIKSSTKDVPLLSFEQIKACIRRELKNPESVLWKEIRREHLGKLERDHQYEMNKLSLKLRCIQFHGEEIEKTIMPVWDITSRLKINAIDGSLIVVEEATDGSLSVVGGSE